MYYQTLQKLWLDSFPYYHSCSQHCYMYYQTSKTLWLDSFPCSPCTTTAAVVTATGTTDTADTVAVILQCRLAMLQVIAVTVETYDQIATK